MGKNDKLLKRPKKDIGGKINENFLSLLKESKEENYDINLFICNSPTCFNRDPYDILKDEKKVELYEFFFGGIDNFAGTNGKFYGELCTEEFNNIPGFVSVASIDNVNNNPKKYQLKVFNKKRGISAMKTPYKKFTLNKIKQMNPSRPLGNDEMSQMVERYLK